MTGITSNAFCAWPPLPSNYVLKKIHKDHDAQGFNVKFTYINLDNPVDETIYRVNQYGYLGYSSDTFPEHNNSNRPTLSTPLFGTIHKLEQDAIDVYLQYQGYANNENTQTPLTIHTTFNNSSEENRLVKIYVDGEHKYTLESTGNTTFQSEVLGLAHDSSHTVEWKDNDGATLGTVNVPAGWEYDEWAYGTVTFEGAPFYHEIENPFDNDAPDTELPVPDEWYPDDWEYPQTDDLSDDDYNPPDYGDLPQDPDENHEPDNPDRNEMERDDDIPDSPSELDNSNTDLTQEDIYEAMRKALHDEGNMYDFDDLDELDNEGIDNDGGLVSMMDNTSGEFDTMLQRNRSAFNKFKNKLDSIHTLNLPQNIGNIEKIDITVPWDTDNETYTIDLTEFQDEINLFRSIMLVILGVLNWIATIYIIRQGIS